MSRWSNYAEKFYALPRPRRAFWLALGLIAVTSLGYGQWVQPQWQQWQTAQQRLTQLEQEQQQLTQTRVQTQRALAGDPDAALKEQQAQANARLERLQTTLRERTAYVSAKDNRALLQAMLALADELEVSGVEALPPEPIQIAEAATVPEQAATSESAQSAQSTQSARQKPTQIDSGIYQHRLKLTLAGTYFEIKAYFDAMEALPWSFYWNRLDYQASEYPRAVVEVEIYTLSMERDYVGV